MTIVPVVTFRGAAGPHPQVGEGVDLEVFHLPTPTFATVTLFVGLTWKFWHISSLFQTQLTTDVYMKAVHIYYDLEKLPKDVKKNRFPSRSLDYNILVTWTFGQVASVNQPACFQGEYLRTKAGRHTFLL